MGMSFAEWKAAIESVNKVVARWGDTAKDTSIAFKELADYMVCGPKEVIGRITNDKDDRAVKTTEQKEESMLDTEYTSVYSDLKTDWDEKKIDFVDMSTIDF